MTTLLGVSLAVDPVTLLTLLWVGALIGFGAALLLLKEAQ